jgi:hypothetical protein
VWTTTAIPTVSAIDTTTREERDPSNHLHSRYSTPRMCTMEVYRGLPTGYTATRIPHQSTSWGTTVVTAIFTDSQGLRTGAATTIAAPRYLQAYDKNTTEMCSVTGPRHKVTSDIGTKHVHRIAGKAEMVPHRKFWEEWKPSRGAFFGAPERPSRENKPPRDVLIRAPGRAEKTQLTRNTDPKMEPVTLDMDPVTLDLDQFVTNMDPMSPSMDPLSIYMD